MLDSSEGGLGGNSVFLRWSKILLSVESVSSLTLRNEVRAEVGPIIPFGPARLRDIVTRLVASSAFNGLS